jgi:MFS family permease
LKNLQTFSSLYEPGFRLYWISTLATYAASQMDMMIKGWLIFEMTGLAVDLGMVTLAAGVPLIITSFFGGVIADRVDRHKSLLITQAAAIGIAATMTILLITHLLQYWHFILLAALQGIVFAFIAPLRQSIVARLVKPANLMNAVALSSTSYNIMGVAGPAAAGLLLTSMPAYQVYFIIIGLYITGAITLVYIRLPVEKVVGDRSFHLDMAEGFRYIGRNRKILVLLLIALVPAFLSLPYIYMMPALALGWLKEGQAGLGFLLAAAGIGALTGSLIVGSLSAIKSKGTLVLALMLMFGISLCLMTQFPIFAWVTIMLFFAAVNSTAYMTLDNTLILSSVPQAIHGRIISIFIMTVGLTPIGALPMGFLADHIGIPATFMIAGCVAALFALAIYIFAPTIRKMR